MHGRAADWAANTGTIVWGLSKHLRVRQDAERFAYYRQMLLDAHAWIERTRRRTLTEEYPEVGKGLFPAMVANDNSRDISRVWVMTDAWNVMAYEELTHLLELFDDPEKGRVRQSYEEYKGAMESVLAEVIRNSESDDELAIPSILGVAPTNPPNYWVDFHAAPRLIRSKVIEPKSTMFEQVEAYMRNRGRMQNGLVGSMRTRSRLNNEHRIPGRSYVVPFYRGFHLVRCVAGTR